MKIYPRYLRMFLDGSVRVPAPDRIRFRPLRSCADPLRARSPPDRCRHSHDWAQLCIREHSVLDSEPGCPGPRRCRVRSCSDLQASGSLHCRSSGMSQSYFRTSAHTRGVAHDPCCSSPPQLYRTHLHLGRYCRPRREQSQYCMWAAQA